jgi:cholesterol oxidase
MRGFFSASEQDDYARGYERGEKEGSPFEFVLTVVADDVRRLIDQPKHEASMSGTVTAPALSGQPLRVANGRFNLFVEDPDRVLTRRMTYRMPMTAADGKVYFMDGFKLIHPDKPTEIWPATTTLYITVYAGGDDSGPVIGKGIVKILLKDFVRQLTTMRAVNAPNELAGLRALAEFGEFFAGVLNEVYGGVFAPATYFNPDAPPRQKRPLRVGPPEVHSVTTRDGVGLRLTRFPGGKKGPVILSPGFGTSALAFTIDTTATNLPEFLFEAGYDVWVFDYRASPALPSAATQFTLDDIATQDYPAAVRKVLEVSGAGSVQVMTHCVGSLTFLMAQVSGLQGVRSAVCSALTLHPVAPPINEIKARLHLASVLTALGVKVLTTDIDSHANWFERFADELLKFYPSHERCNSPVCRRILFLYGDVYDHQQLNDATHLAIHEMFGPANMTTFRHLSRILNAGHAVTADGQDVYLANADRIKLPIAFLHGENNHLFLPAGSLRTYEFLCERNGPRLYSRHVIPGYAHMDCFIGRDAARDVYPVVLRELDRYNDPAPVTPGNPRRDPQADGQAGERALAELSRYPLLTCLAERRTRRIARGTSVEAGELSYESRNPPHPLNELEEAILIVALGVTGFTAHDGPLDTRAGGKELGTPFLHVVAGTASSADNCQATRFFLINDDGIWLLKRPTGPAALQALGDLPPRWADWKAPDWIAAARAVKVRLHEGRLEFPREYPYYLGWNKQISNVPGTTLFFPVVDCTRQYINALLILLSEPAGQRPLIVDDWRRFRPRGWREVLAWLGSALGLSESIPYQPVGGLKWVRNGFVNKKNAVPLGAAGALRTDYEAFFFLQNLMLVGQALGLGGWIHGSVFPPYVYQRDPARKWFGLGFRMAEPTRRPRPTPPAPASRPNPVGIPGQLEGLCPPFVRDMGEAVDRVLQEKYGPEGAYGDAAGFARPYRSPRYAEAYLRQASHFSPEAVAYTRDICNYLVDTYGRFPAHVDAFYSPGMWVQFAHLEMEYYRQFYDPAQYRRQADHDALWHGQ